MKNGVYKKLVCSQKTEAATGGVLLEKEFLETSKNSQKNTYVRVSFLIKLQAEACNFIKRESLAQVFFSEFAKFLRTPPGDCFCSQLTLSCIMLKNGQTYFKNLVVFVYTIEPTDPFP